MPSLLVTVDTEPDLPKRRQASLGTLHNIPALVTLQERLPNVRLTLLVTHSVVTDADSLRILERLARDYDCEIGAHLHPEETPPFVRGFPDDTSLMRLPFEARAEKLRTLTRAISAHFPAPRSYRAGRWKLSPEDLGLLADHGYWVDSTVTPYVSWKIEHGPDFADARPEPHRVAGGRLWEVPVTIGLNRGQRLTRAGPLRRALRAYLQLCSLELLGLPAPAKAAWDLARPIRPVWLRPTYSSAREMARLADRVMARSPDAPLTMMFHSNELAPGGRPFIRTQADADRILDRIVRACRYLTERRGAASTTLADYVHPSPESRVPSPEGSDSGRPR
ncbi:MAG: hypothetical protein H0V51_20040 [Chloroflexi bacterium]|nr:hypothetical protein [Chloroflexota bacterium]